MKVVKGLIDVSQKTLVFVIQATREAHTKAREDEPALAQAHADAVLLIGLPALVENNIVRRTFNDAVKEHEDHLGVDVTQRLRDSHEEAMNVRCVELQVVDQFGVSLNLATSLIGQLVCENR